MPENTSEKNDNPQPETAPTKQQTAPSIEAPRSPLGATPEMPQTAASSRMEKRPHHVNVLFSSIAALAAIVTLYFTFRGQQSTNLSQESNNTLQEIGQQAYIAVKEGKIEFAPMEAGPPPQAEGHPGVVVNPEPAGPLLATTITVTIYNNGNTAAEFLRFTGNFDALPEGWSLRKRYAPQEKPDYIAPKSHIDWKYHQPFNLTADAWSRFNKQSGQGVMSFLDFQGELVSKDELNREHTTRWCWQTLARIDNNGQVFPRQCDNGPLTLH